MRYDRPILHIVPSEPYGGIQALVPMLAQEQRQHGADVRILCLGRGQRIRLAAAEAGLADRTRSLAGPGAARGVFAAVARNEGIVHSHCEPVWASLILATMRSRRWIAHAHVYPDDMLTWKKRLSLHVQRRFAARHIAISHSIGRALLATGTANPATLDIVHNGMRIEPAEAVPRLPRPAFTVGFVGRAVAEKGLFDFVALAGLLAATPGFEFAVYGDGADLAAARADAAACGLGGRIVFHGHVEDIARAWATIDAAAVFSHREPFGLVFLEAALHGAATVSFENDSGGSELAATLRSAHRVAPGDLAAAAGAVRALAADRAATARALPSDRAVIAARYDIASMARGVAESYARLDTWTATR